MKDNWSCRFGSTWHSSEKSIDSDSTIGWVEVHDGNGNTVAMVTDEGGGITIKASDEEMERRAHLIAAAPELYEALDQAITSMQDSGYQNDHVVIRAGRAALAKARGEAS